MHTVFTFQDPAGMIESALKIKPVQPAGTHYTEQACWVCATAMVMKIFYTFEPWIAVKGKEG